MLSIPMFRRRPRSAALAAVSVLAGLAASHASGQVLWDDFPAYSTNVGQMNQPPDHLAPEEIPGDLINWKWRGANDVPPGPWKPGLPADLFALGRGEVIYLGLDNLYLGPDWTKTVELKFTYSYEEGHTVTPSVDLTWGYHSDPSRGGAQGQSNQASTTTRVEFSDPQAGIIFVDCTYTWVFTQSDWEYVRIRNTSQDAQAVMSNMQSITFRSHCVPSPASVGVLALAGLAASRRRRS